MPIFLGALLLSMDNWKHDTFFMLYFKKKEKIKKIITVLCLSKLTNILFCSFTPKGVSLITWGQSPLTLSYVFHFCLLCHHNSACVLFVINYFELDRGGIEFGLLNLGGSAYWALSKDLCLYYI